VSKTVSIDRLKPLSTINVTGFGQGRETNDIFVVWGSDALNAWGVSRRGFMVEPEMRHMYCWMPVEAYLYGSGARGWLGYADGI